MISPLIALMHDQIRAAEAAGISAASLTSADTNRDETLNRLHAGELDLLYVAPERASGEGFRRMIDADAAGADRDRRSALRQRMGARLPPRLSPAARPARRPPRRAAAGADRDRRRAHPRRHPRPARHSPGRADHRRVRPAQHPLSHPPARRLAGAIEGARGEPAGAGNRLCAEPGRGREDRRAIAGERAARSGLSRRARGAGPLAQPVGVRRARKRW